MTQEFRTRGDLKCLLKKNQQRIEPLLAIILNKKRKINAWHLILKNDIKSYDFIC